MDLSLSVQTLKEKVGTSCQASLIGVVHISSSHQQASRHACQHEEQHRGGGRMDIGARRSHAFFDVQVASWWDLD